ncbi:hypothetical protein ACQEVF_59685 [Nonomuraea polychroma]|uniref:hypothetical protein n=1 Tax=Nonomuraea polychroma TaxID=46176 RepID=UPI003D8EF7E6
MSAERAAYVTNFTYAERPGSRTRATHVVVAGAALLARALVCAVLGLAIGAILPVTAEPPAPVVAEADK